MSLLVNLFIVVVSTLVSFLLFEIIKSIYSLKKDDKELKDLIELSNLHTFAWKEKYINILLDKISNRAINFCIENSIPLYETYCNKDYFKGKEEDSVVAGRICYNQGYNKTVLINPIIEINAHYYNSLPSNYGDKYNDIAKTLKIHTLCHEIGHYIELTTKGETTEDGANWEAAKFASSCLNNTQIWALTRASVFFQGIERQNLPDTREWITNLENRAELLQEFNTYKEIV